MTFFAEFFTMAITAIFLENLVFSRALGTSRIIAQVRQGKNMTLFGLMLTGMITLCSLATSLVDNYLLEIRRGSVLRPALYVLLMTLVYGAVYLSIRQWAPKLFQRIGALLPFATFNSALLGSVFLAASQSFSVTKSVGFGLGSGVGFTLATLLVYEGRRRLRFSDVPRSFRGFPILLMYLGFVALALYGLVGHQLPF